MLPGIWVGRQLTSSWLSVSAVAVADYLSLGSKSPWLVKTKMHLAHNYLPLAYIFQQIDCYEQNQQRNNIIRLMIILIFNFLRKFCSLYKDILVRNMLG